MLLFTIPTLSELAKGGIEEESQEKSSVLKIAWKKKPSLTVKYNEIQLLSQVDMQLSIFQTYTQTSTIPTSVHGHMG